MKINLITYGTKHREEGSVTADFDFPCYHLANPHNTSMKNLNGLDSKVQAFVFHYSENDAWGTIAAAEDVIGSLADDGNDEVTVAFHCIGGRHRSVSLAERLAKELKVHFRDTEVNVNHMELSNDS